MNVLQLGLLDTVDLERFRPGDDKERAVTFEDEAVLRIVEGAEGAAAAAPIAPEHGSTPASASTDVTWLRRTEYLSSEAKNKPTTVTKVSSTTTGASASKPAIRRPSSSTMAHLGSKGDVIGAIEASFAYRPRSQQLTHPTASAHVRPVAIFPVLPSTLSPSTYTQCTFDADPSVSTVDGISIAAQGDQRALIKAMSSAEDANDTFVWYYLPAAERELEDTNEDSGASGRFVYTRDYDVQRIERATVGFTGSSTASLTYFVLGVPKASMDADDTVGAVYAPITNSFHLKKRRVPSDHSKNRHSLKVTRTQ